MQFLWQKKKLVFVFLLFLGGFLFVWQSLLSDSDKKSSLREMENQDFGVMALQIPLEETVAERAIFIEEFRKKKTFILKDFYDDWLGKIGANGIIKGISEVDPLCHDTAHDLGRLIYEKTLDVGVSLLTCDNSCNSGCMHGVLMGFFQKKGLAQDGHEHIHLEDVKVQIGTICGDAGKKGNETMAKVYKQGDCVHGVGHAMMYLSDYDIPKSLELCGLFDSDVLDYYCATGAYMEYNTNFGIKNLQSGKGIFYPCDHGDYPAACFRYKMAHVVPLIYAKGGNLDSLQDACLKLKDKYRLGCFHGLGNGHYGMLAGEKIFVDEVCAKGDADDQYVCIEGAIERLARYMPKTAKRQCDTLARGWRRDLCLQAFGHELYDLEKPFELYKK